MEDIKAGKSREEVTFSVQRDIANSLYDFLKFTGEFATDAHTLS